MPQKQPPAKIARSVVAMDSLLTGAASAPGGARLLFLERIARLGIGLEPFDRDRRTARFGDAVGAGVDLLQCALDIVKPRVSERGQVSLEFQFGETLRVVLRLVRLHLHFGVGAGFLARLCLARAS